MIIGRDAHYQIVDPKIEHIDLDTTTPEGDARFIQVVGECALEAAFDVQESNSQLDAFLFWSRAPFATRAEDGSVVLHDARFYDPLARDRFSIALTDVECVPLPSELPSE